MNESCHQVYVELDCLLDTHLAVLGELYPAETQALLVSGQYHARRHNRFQDLNPVIDQARFEAAYQARDTRVLQTAITTNVIELLGDLVGRYLAMSNQLKESVQVKIDINVYPYRLTPEEKTALVETIQAILLTAEVRTCSIPPLAQTPPYLAQYDSVLMYEFDAWMNQHHELFKAGRMRDATIYAPEIILPTAEDVNKFHPATPARELKLLLVEFATVEIVPLGFFSVLKPTTA